ncbi:hypothetical protein V8E53_001696 [Lactarius tabidus]
MAVADLTSIARRSSKQRATFDSNTGPCPSVPSPASGGALHCSAAPVHSLFTFSLKPNAPVCDQVIFPMGSDAGIELDGKEVAGKWYSSLMQDQGAKVCSSSRILHSMTLNFRATQPTSLLPLNKPLLEQARNYEKNMRLADHKLRRIVFRAPTDSAWYYQPLASSWASSGLGVAILFVADGRAHAIEDGPQQYECHPAASNLVAGGQTWPIPGSMP